MSDEIPVQAGLNVQGARRAGLLPCQLGQGLTQQPPLLLGHEFRGAQGPCGTSADNCEGDRYEEEDTGEDCQELLEAGERVSWRRA